MSDPTPTKRMPAARPSRSKKPSNPTAAEAVADDQPTEVIEPQQAATPAPEPEASGPTDAPAEEPAGQEVVIVELTQTQLQNDPLLTASDDVFADLLEKLRWATVGWVAVGVIAAWAFACLIAVGTGNVSAFAWAAGATILVVAGGIWYLIEGLSRFDDADAYLRAASPYTLARLDRPAVVGLSWQLGVWIGVALAALAAISGALTFTVALVAGANGWLWLIAALPLLIAYLAWFLLLQFRLVERTRDAVA